MRVNVRVKVRVKVGVRINKRIPTELAGAADRVSVTRMVQYRIRVRVRV